MNSHEQHHLTGNATSAPVVHGSHPLMPRRVALGALGMGAAALTGVGAAFGAARNDDDGSAEPHPLAHPTPEDAGWDPAARRYVLPPLPYSYDALEPHIDAQTMELHHSKHHQSYVNGLNTALERLEEIRNGQRSTDEIKHWSRELAFHGSGHLMHVIFWNCMSPGGGGRPSGDISGHINHDFGSFDKFARHFHAAANAVEASGWAILCLDVTSGKLMVLQAEKHQNLTVSAVVPLVAVDVWEHAYYLKYQNDRAAYVDAFMNVVNWEFADRKLRGIKDALTV